MGDTMEDDTMEKKGWKVEDFICLKTTYDSNTWTYIPICEKITIIGDVQREAIGKNRGRVTKFNDVTLETIDGATRIVKSYDMPYKYLSMSLKSFTTKKEASEKIAAPQIAAVTHQQEPIETPFTESEISPTLKNSILTAVQGCYPPKPDFDNAIINAYNSSNTKDIFLGEEFPSGLNKYVIATKLFNADGSKLYGGGEAQKKNKQKEKKNKQKEKKNKQKKINHIIFKQVSK